MMDVDIDLIVRELRANGHSVEDIHRVSTDAGEFEMIIDGNVVNLEGARSVIEMDATKKKSVPGHGHKSRRQV